MKNTRLTSILSSSVISCALAIGSLASTQFASAQSPITMAEVNIPYAFQTQMQTLPAGKYRVVLESDNLVRLEGAGSTGGFVITRSAFRSHASQNGTIVFDRY